jgi:hypothetical protein
MVALTALATLLRRVLNERFSPSNEPLSSARLSHEANRGEIHAKSDEADAGARCCRWTCLQGTRRRPSTTGRCGPSFRRRYKQH